MGQTRLCRVLPSGTCWGGSLGGGSARAPAGLCPGRPAQGHSPADSGEQRPESLPRGPRGGERAALSPPQLGPAPATPCAPPRPSPRRSALCLSPPPGRPKLPVLMSWATALGASHAVPLATGRDFLPCPVTPSAEPATCMHGTSPLPSDTPSPNGTAAPRQPRRRGAASKHLSKKYCFSGMRWVFMGRNGTYFYTIWNIVYYRK